MPLERGQLEEAAAFLFHLRVQRQTVAALPHEIAPRTIDDAYAIQDALHAAAGWPIGVLKVGCTSEVAQAGISSSVDMSAARRHNAGQRCGQMDRNMLLKFRKIREHGLA